MLEIMSNEIEDPSPFTKIIPAGEIIPGNDNLNIGLTKHIEKRLALLGQDSIEAHTIYLLAPWKMIGRRKRISEIHAKQTTLGIRLAASEREDLLREERTSQQNVTVLPIDVNASLDAVENSSDALVLDLQEYEQRSLTRLDNDTAAEHSLAVVDNG